MRQRIRQGAGVVWRVAKARPKEARWSVIGIAAGTFVGLLIGGVGVAALGGAVGLPAAVVLAALGGLVGNRYGVEQDARDRR